MSAARDLLFGLLALQNGMVSRDQLVAAFGAWTGAPARPMAEILVEHGALSPSRRALLDALAAEHLAAHGGTAEAISLNEATLKLFESKLGPDHPYTLISRGNLA